MKKYVIIIWTLATIAFFCIMHQNLIRSTVISDNQVSYEQPIPSIAHGYQIAQKFIPQHDFIESVQIYVSTLECSKTQGYLMTRILDSAHNPIYEKATNISELPDYGCQDILNNISVDSGDTYYLTVDAVDTIDDGPVVLFYPTEIAASKEEENQQLTYAGLPLDNSVLKITFQYGVPVLKTDYIAYYLFLSLILAMIISHIKIHRTKK